MQLKEARLLVETLGIRPLEMPLIHTNGKWEGTWCVCVSMCVCVCGQGGGAPGKGVGVFPWTPFFLERLGDGGDGRF